MIAGGLAAVVVTPAAAEAFTGVTRASWAFTDLREPRSTFTEGDAPVGAWRDGNGGYHSSKSYFTFDLAELRGARVLEVSAQVAETATNDCDKPRATEMWVTDTVDRPTWVHQPRERTKLSALNPHPGCVSRQIGWDATDAVRHALSAGTSQLMLALRMPARKQFDVTYGRRYANDMRLFVRYNRPPGPPTNLTVDFRQCGDPFMFSPNQLPTLRARFDDPDGTDRLTATFAVWPVDDPTRRTELTTQTVAGVVAQVSLAEGTLHDAVTYEWAAQASDGHDTSAWSVPCRFTVDSTPPSVEPTVSSSDYPADCAFPWCGGLGVPGRFTFTANGVSDVVGFRYGQNDQPVTFVPAEQLGGTASISFTPTSPGLNRLYARSVDRAGNVSPTTVYTFFVRDNRPIVSCVPEHRGLGEPRECTFAPNMPAVVSYRYRFNNGPEITVPANGDGIAMVTLRPITTTFPPLRVTSVTSDGIEATLDTRVFVAPSEPDVSSDIYQPFDYAGGVGVPGQFTFTPHMPNVADWVYQFDNDAEIVVPADADGAATITYTPTSPDAHTIAVVSRTADGIRSSEGGYLFFVNP